MPEGISEHLLDQRSRNRVMESILWLAEGIGPLGASEYFNQFLFQMGPDERPQANIAMNREEAVALAGLCDMVGSASDATSRHISDAELAASPWLVRIQSQAESALAIFLKRGRSDEDAEEAEPSSAAGQLWLARARGI